MSQHLIPALGRRRRNTPRPSAGIRALDPVRTALGLATVLVLSALMSIHFLPDHVSVHIGEPSPAEIRATRSATYVDTDATRRRRDFNAARVVSSYDADPTARTRALHSVNAVFAAVRRGRNEPAGDERVARVMAETGTALKAVQVRYLLAATPGALENIEAATRRLVTEAMQREIRSNTDDLSHASAGLAAAAHRSLSRREEAEIARAVCAQALRPNLLYNPVRTEAQREAAARYVPSVTGQVRLGDVLVREGEVVTQLHLDQLAALGLITRGVDFGTLGGVFALAAGMVVLVGYYLRRNCPALYDNPRQLLLLAGIASLSVFGLRLFGALLGLPLTYVQFGYLGMMTVVVAGMLITVFFGTPLAILVTALLSVLSGLVMNHEIRFAVMYFVSSLVGIYSVGNIRNRTHMVRAAFSVGAVNVALVWVLGGLLGDSLQEVLTGSVWALAAGVVATSIAWFAVAVLEKPFGILTHVWLLELSASEHPLLRELCVAAPGTYAHSVMVGNLAEAAAEAVGADTLLARVGAYYHDVGKLRVAHCFIENQMADNIHDRLSPSLSALVIASHVRDGLEMAEKHHLPREVKDLIAQHHGTSLIRYFYHQALADAQGNADPAMEQRFRYDGPRPQSREAGIIMLADSVEAAARTCGKATPARLQGLIADIFREKLGDGQLDECDLTLKDLQRIQEAFLRVLGAMLHSRVDYPDAVAQNSEGERAASVQGTDADADNDLEPAGQAPVGAAAQASRGGRSAG